MEPTMLHIDMDAFFASVEQARDPSLRGKPVAVIGGGGRTVITTASYEARAFGVKSGMPLFEGKRRCPGLVVVTGNHQRYTAVSREIIAIFREYTPDVTVFSIDEAFLDVAGSVRLFGPPATIARSIQQRIRERFSLSCSVGIAPNRTLAKLASGMNKPAGLTIIRPEDVAPLLERTPIGELCGIGPKTQQRLSQLGIRTCGELARFPRATLDRMFGVLGGKLIAMAKGEDSDVIGFGNHEEGVKSVGHSSTLDRDISETADIAAELRRLSAMVGLRARRHQLRGESVSIQLRYTDFTTINRQRTLPCAIDRDDQIFAAGCEILATIERPLPVRLVGIQLGRLTATRQLHLMHEEQQKDAVQETIDLVNQRFGGATVTNGELLRKQKEGVVIPPSWRPEGIRDIRDD